MTPEETAVRGARELLSFADGVEAANPSMLDYAQRARNVAHDCIRYVEKARNEERLRHLMQAQRDEARRLKIVRTPEEA